ncbi:MAG: hypothetical protein Q8O90_09260, partial [Elusimicrobiota bacterium]|nr:hypothetical protein [Elusimicrobiota bacterium]
MSHTNRLRIFSGALLRACAAVLFALNLVFPRPALGQQPAVDVKKKNLEEINRQLKGKEQELEQLRLEEERIAAEISGLKKEEKQTATRRVELEGQLDKSRSRSGEARQKYESLEKARKELAGDISGEL